MAAVVPPTPSFMHTNTSTYTRTHAHGVLCKD